jgi:hypothetical protein
VIVSKGWCLTGIMAMMYLQDVCSAGMLPPVTMALTSMGTLGQAKLVTVTSADVTLW